MNRKRFLQTLLLAPAAAAFRLSAAGPAITVYKTSTCGCCGNWVEHLKAAGFAVKVETVEDMAPTRKKYGVPEAVASCHTGIIDGYAIEGHVPAADIIRLLKERPKATGLAVPGMVMGSPGMEGPKSDAYSVLLFSTGGKPSIYKSYAGK